MNKKELNIGSGSHRLTVTFKGPPLTERAKQMCVESAARCFGPAGLFGAKFAEQYEKAYYETLLHSPAKRTAFEFLRTWLSSTALSRESGRPMTKRQLSLVFAPLVEALEKRDSEFFKGLAEAVRIIEQREQSANLKYQASLGKWLLEYWLLIGGTPTHTFKQLKALIKESGLRVPPDNKLYEKCREYDLLKLSSRGRPRNMPPLIRKRNIRVRLVAVTVGPP